MSVRGQSSPPCSCLLSCLLIYRFGVVDPEDGIPSGENNMITMKMSWKKNKISCSKQLVGQRLELGKYILKGIVIIVTKLKCCSFRNKQMH